MMNSGLTSLDAVFFTLDGTGTLAQLNQLTSIRDGDIQIEGGNYSYPPNLTTFDGTSVNVQNGAIFTLPSLTSYSSFSSYAESPTLQATGTGSTLDMPAVTTIQQNFGTLDITASSGGKVAKWRR